MNTKNVIHDVNRQMTDNCIADGFLKLSSLDLFGIDSNAFREKYVPLWEGFCDMVEALKSCKTKTGGPLLTTKDEITLKIFSLLSGYERDSIDYSEEQTGLNPRQHDFSYTEWSNLRFKSHILLPWLYELLTEKITLQTKTLIQTILNTDDVVIWSTDWCVKPPSSKSKFSWHQDSTYSGFTQGTGLTLWIAFSNVTPESGPMVFKVGSHRLGGQLYHFEDDSDPDNMLAFGQTIPRSIFPSIKETYHLEMAELCSEDGLNHLEVKERTCALKNLSENERRWELCPSVSHSLLPGEATCHGFHTVHSSQANCGATARVGLAVRLVRADCGVAGKRKDRVTKFAGDIKGALKLGGDHGFEEELSDGSTSLPFEELVNEWKLSLEREKEEYFKGCTNNNFGKFDYKG